ncbi:MAG: hypothetical protein O3C27_12345 [Actinomycetota bacterium]|nr:hypothetical protein [Actinomycetota bacterium]
MTEIAVGVVIPMLNEIDHIGACASGVQAQTCPAEWIVEILVVDGGSLNEQIVQGLRAAARAMTSVQV